MLLDLEVQRCTRRCAATDRALEPGEICFSVLEVHGADMVRKDYSGEAWNGPPGSAFGWWKFRIPHPSQRKIKLAPNEVLLELFDQYADRPEQYDMRYVLALLLVRRRVLRLDVPHELPQQPHSKPWEGTSDSAIETLVVYCPKRDAAYEVPAVMPSRERIEEIQQQLSDLLVAGAE